MFNFIHILSGYNMLKSELNSNKADTGLPFTRTSLKTGWGHTNQIQQSAWKLRTRAPSLVPCSAQQAKLQLAHECALTLTGSQVTTILICQRRAASQHYSATAAPDRHQTPTSLLSMFGEACHTVQSQIQTPSQ